jgi:hypothetical protein
MHFLIDPYEAACLEFAVARYEERPNDLTISASSVASERSVGIAFG